MASLAMRKITEKIKSYPTAFGALVGLLIVGAIFIIETWFPWLGNAWERHNSLVQPAHLGRGGSYA